MSDFHNGPSRPAANRWSTTAREIVRANMNARGRELSQLVTDLVQESGKRQQRAWTVPERQRLLKLLDLHPISEIARLMRRPQSSIWHMLYRLGASAKMGKDSFTKYTLAQALHVGTERIESWISCGWLKAHEMVCGQTIRTVIQSEDFCDFCRKHTRDVVGNRLSKERLDFVFHFAFPPSHAELLPVRESKKERIAYEELLREEREESEEQAPKGCPVRIEEADDALEEIA